jgi:hypothetical protein
MPYIKHEDREKFEEITKNIINYHDDRDIFTILGEQIHTAGELNYVISKICLEFLKYNKNYQRMNDIMGALTGVQLELYRRVTAPYEDLKIAESGDIL